MLRIPRIGLFFGPSMDPFWVQVLEAIYQKAEDLGLELIAIDSELPPLPSGEEETALYEELLAQDLDIVIGWGFPEDLARRVLASGVPIVHLNETEIVHPLSVSPRGLYDIARLIGAFLVEKLHGQGSILAVGGLCMPGRNDDGRSRVAGFQNALALYPDIRFQHIPAQWSYDEAYTQIHAALSEIDGIPDAIFGLSDTLALAARDAGRTLRRVASHTLIVGVNGDPLALAAISEGSMTATVETSTEDLGRRAVELAYQMVRHHPVPRYYSFQSRLVTAHNVGDVAAQKLIGIAKLPSRLIGANRQQQQERVIQLETSLAINRRVGSILNSRQLASEIAHLIRDSYGYDQVWFYRWLVAEQRFEREDAGNDQTYAASIPLERAGVLAQALLENAPLFIPDARRSSRFMQDPDWPDTRSRVVIPVRFSDSILGVLDLHSQHSTQHTRRELIGLQALADQLGIGIRNAELYSEAIQARAVAERADLLKTRLLANVSHELRTPLDIIIGYSQATPGAESESSERQHIHRSAEHLRRLIDDLLDLSRAEVNELDLAPELLDPRSLFAEVFSSIAVAPGAEREVAWHLQLPDRLPMLHADPVRLRQILLNLLSNARKSTERGQITLGAEAAPPYLHIWVRDTGTGIPAELQERIFEPFATLEQTKRRGEGIGLGLSITRRLVALHHGSMTLESQPMCGSTFHVYLPLPTLDRQLPAPLPLARSVLLAIGPREQLAPEMIELADRQGLAIQALADGDDLHAALVGGLPAAIAWDITYGDARHWTLAQSLRAHPQLGQVPFILYGAAGPAPAELGITSFIAKPVPGQTLQDLIQAMCLNQATGALLIVDDNPQALELYRGIAAKSLPHCRILIAHDGAAAVALMAEATPAAVMLDLIMPELDGFQVLDWMRANPRTRRVPVLVLSGRVLSFDDVKRIEQHALVTLQSKDILSEQELVQSVQQVLGGTLALGQSTSSLVKRALAYIHQHYEHPFTRNEIAQSVGVTDNYLSRIFRLELGLSPWEYLTRYRIRQARQLLRVTNDNITDIALRVGFDDKAYFTRVFHRYAGCSPSVYRKRRE
jgi:signal transduction histidine kinase/AraC-like DNA-binding protein/ABC-type sugar transport system substrate-binding protein